MRITHWLEYSEEIEIELRADDISILFRESHAEKPEHAITIMLNNLNSVAGFLRGIPDEVINELSDGQRETISKFLKEEGDRFSPALAQGDADK